MPKTIGVSKHPAREEMKQLWLKGHRAAYIVAWLEARSLPPVKKGTIESYGRKYWNKLLNPSIVIEMTDDDSQDTGFVRDTSGDEDDVAAAQELIQRVAESGLGQIKNIKIGSKEYPTWRRGEDDEVAVSEMGSSRMRTIEIVPSAAVGLRRTQRTEVDITFKVTGERVEKRDGWKIGIFLPDMQIGYFDTGKELIPTHDEAAIDVAHQIMAQVQQKYGIDIVINAGDNLDLPAFSTHRSAPGYLGTTQDALNRASEEAAIQRAIAPDARIAWIEGNHEQRLTNFLVDKAPQVLGLTRVGEDVPVMAVPYLCRFEEYDVEWIGPYPDGEIWVNDHLRFEHGSLYSSSPGATAAKYLKNGVSVGHGHSHRIEYLEETRQTARGPRTHFAGSPGCLCRIDGKVPSAKTGIDASGAQSGGKVENWHQGIWVFAYQEDGKQLANVEAQVSIWGGWARFEGRDYFATVDVDGNPINDREKT